MSAQHSGVDRLQVLIDCNCCSLLCTPVWRVFPIYEKFQVFFLKQFIMQWLDQMQKTVRKNSVVNNFKKVMSLLCFLPPFKIRFVLNYYCGTVPADSMELFSQDLKETSRVVVLVDSVFWNWQSPGNEGHTACLGEQTNRLCCVGGTEQFSCGNNWKNGLV